VPYIAVAVYVAVGFYRWHLDRQSFEPEGLRSVISWTLILGTMVNFIVWVVFSR
jgi:hypothetical protein